jgi:hypothetical protein
MLAGWDGAPDPGSSQRIRDLAEVEELAGPNLLPGLGDRLRKALTELDRRDPKFAAIEVLENPDSLPLLLRKALVKLDQVVDGGAANARPKRAPVFGRPRASRKGERGQSTILDRSRGLPIKGRCPVQDPA